jgi:hypothetical protein
MAVTKRPSIDVKKADKFIDGAKADTVKPQMRESGQTTNQNNVKPENSIKDKKVTSKVVKPQKRQTVKTVKKTKLTFYMDPDMYLKWKTYELEQLQAGNKVSFQGVVEKYMRKILR